MNSSFPHKFLLILCMLWVLAGSHAQAQQGLKNLWMGGFEEESGLPWGGTDLDFIFEEVVISQVDREIDFKRTNTNITNTIGTLLFSTNGAYIANASGDTMPNGTGLSPSNYTSTFPAGLHLPQAVMILPWPENPDLFVLFHSTYDDYEIQSAMQLYTSMIDLSTGSGVTSEKNQIIIADTLNLGKITGVRHANGRDWWVFCHKQDTNIFYRILLTPNGLSEPIQQAIGIVRAADGGQVCFSPDGSKFAYYWGDDEDLEIFNFDRCTGLFSDPVHIPIDDANAIGGVAFSPNNRFLYVSSVEDVYQYDTEASDIEASMVHIAEWDGFYSPSPPFATLFDIAQLAPDGKIYISTGNGTQHLHVINEPDQAGMACEMVQHGVELPTYYMNSLPNHPNYHLGPVDGSICDSLGINTDVATLSMGEVLGVRVHPNPGKGLFTLNYPAQPVEGLLEVMDGNGRIIHRKQLSQWTTLHRLDLTGHAPGLYHCRLSWGLRSASTRLIIQDPE